LQLGDCESSFADKVEQLPNSDFPNFDVRFLHKLKLDFLTVGRIRPFPNRVENFIGIFNSMRPSAVGVA
jgi:hypothetical protein